MPKESLPSYTQADQLERIYNLSEMTEDARSLDLGIQRVLKTLSTVSERAGAVRDLSEDDLQKVRDFSEEITLTEQENHPHFETAIIVALSLQTNRVDTELVESLSEITDPIMRDAVIHAGTEIWIRNRERENEMRQETLNARDEQFARSIASSNRQLKPVIDEFRRRAGLEKEGLYKREMKRRAAMAFVAALNGSWPDQGVARAVMEARGGSEVHQNERGLLTDAHRTLPDSLKKIPELHKITQEAMNPGSEMISTMTAAALSGSELVSLATDVLHVYLADSDNLSRRVLVEMSLNQIIDWWVGNTPIKTSQDSFVAAEDIDLTLTEGFTSAEEFKPKQYENRTDVKVAAKNRIVLDESAGLVFEDGEYIDVSALTPSQQARLKTRHFGDVELVSIISAGSDFKISELPAELQSQMRDKIKYKEAEVYHKQLFTSDYKITFGSGNNRIEINAGEEFVFEDLPEGLRRQMAEGKYRIAPVYWGTNPLNEDLTNPMNPKWKSPGEEAYGQRADVNMRDLFDPFFFYLADKAGVDPGEIRGFFGPEGINIGPYRAFVTRDEGLLAKAVKAEDDPVNGVTDRDLSMTNFFRNFFMDTGNMLNTAYQFVDSTGRPATQFDTTHQGQILSRFWEYTLGAEAYDEAKGVSALHFRKLMETLYPDFFGRIWKKTALYQVLHGKSWDVTENVYPFGDVPEWAKRLMSKPVDKLEAFKRVSILEKEFNGLAEKRYYGVITKPEKDRLEFLQGEINTNIEKNETEKADLGQRELVELDQKAQKKGLTPKEENRRKQLLGEIGYAQRQATQLESYLEMLMTERKDHWNNVRDDMFLNYVVKTSRRLYLKGKSPEYIQAFIEKTTLGEVRSEVSTAVLDELESVKPSKRYYNLIANPGYRQERSDTFYLRNVPAFAQRLSGSSDAELNLIRDLNAFETLVSFANEKTQANLTRLHEKCPEMFTGYLGMMELGSELIQLGKIDYGESDRVMQDYLRYLMGTADVYKAVRQLAVDIVQAIDPLVIADYGDAPSDYTPDSIMEGFAKKTAQYFKDRAGIMGDVMSSETVQTYIKTLPEVVNAVVTKYAQGDANFQATVFKNVILMLDQMLDSGLQYVYETTARTNISPGKADQRFGLELLLNSDDGRRREVENNIAKFVRQRGYRVSNTIKPVILREGGHPAYSYEGHFDVELPDYSPDEWVENDYFRDPELGNISSRPLDQYGVLRFMKNGAIAKILLMFGNDQTLVNDEVYEWWTQYWRTFTQEGNSVKAKFIERHEVLEKDRVLVANRWGTQIN